MSNEIENNEFSLLEVKLIEYGMLLKEKSILVFSSQRKSFNIEKTMNINKKIDALYAEIKDLKRKNDKPNFIGVQK